EDDEALGIGAGGVRHGFGSFAPARGRGGRCSSFVLGDCGVSCDAARVSEDRRRMKDGSCGRGRRRMADGTFEAMWSPKMGEAICARIAAGEPLAAICKDPSMPHRTSVRNWRLKDEAFDRAFRAARRTA